jgi:dTDP-4-dehydrorhamnose reductase
VLPSYLPLLVTGIAGVAGYNAFHHFSGRFPGMVIGTRRRDNWRLAGDGIVACDADDPATLKALFDRYGFRAVLNCEGSCALKSCELDPSMAWRINVTAIRHLVDLIVERNIRLVHLSIDLVFSGAKNGGYVELDPPDPVTVYGSTMVEAERLVRRRLASACVLRISLPMGISFNGHAGAIDWIQSRFRHGRLATLYYDEVRCPTYTDCLNRLFESVLENELCGLFHTGGPRQLSLYEIGQIVNRIGGFDPDLLQGCPRKDAGPMPPRAGNVTLVSQKLTDAISRPIFDPWPLADDWVPDHRQWHLERGSSVTGSPDLLARVLYQNPRRTATASWRA